ncbi:MAG: tyrosine-type recombinase/integrase [Candidatus Woesearchaeota archaeon]
MEIARDKDIRNKENRIKKQIEDDRLTEKQRKTMLEYNRTLLKNGLSAHSRSINIKNLSMLFRNTGKEVDQLTKKAVDDFIIDLLENGYNVQSKRFKRKGMYSKQTIEQIKLSIKTFFKRIGKSEVVEDIKIKRNKKFKVPDDIFTKEDILKLVGCADNFRDKALVFTLYESGCRSGEWLNVRLKNVALDEYGAVVVVSGKTGSRRIRLLDSVPDLTSWLNQHPSKNDPEAPLWTNIGSHLDMGLGFNGLHTILNKYAKNSKLNKKIYPHLLRHSRLTHLAGDGFTEAELRIIAGWSADSQMPKVYIHLSGADVDRKQLEKAGKLINEKQNGDKTKPKTCAVCGYENSATNKFCSKCGRPLDYKGAMEFKESESQIKSFVELLMKEVKSERLKEIMNKIS